MSAAAFGQHAVPTHRPVSASTWRPQTNPAIAAALSKGGIPPMSAASPVTLAAGAQASVQSAADTMTTAQLLQAIDPASPNQDSTG